MLLSSSGAASQRADVIFSLFVILIIIFLVIVLVGLVSLFLLIFGFRDRLFLLFDLFLVDLLFNRGLLRSLFVLNGFNLSDRGWAFLLVLDIIHQIFIAAI